MTALEHIFISYRRDGAVNQRWAERIDERLVAEGFAVWRDVTGIQPGQRWAQVIPPALDGAVMVLCVVSKSILESEWVDDELNYARQRKLLVVPLQVDVEYHPPFHLTGVQKLDLHADDDDAWYQLLQLIARHASGGPRWQSKDGHSSQTDLQRSRELKYLDQLLYTQKAVAQLTPIYTELAGVEHRAKTLAKALPADLMPVSFRHARTDDRKLDPPEDARRHTDVLAVFGEYERAGVAPRLTILGEPGAGKSFSLRRLAADYASRALTDVKAPIPLLIELGKWTDPGQSFDTFVRTELHDLGDDLDDLVRSGRVCLLLDALNEIPTAQQPYKINWIEPWLADRRLAGLVLSCRERDFVGDLKLDMDTLTIEPLDPPRIHLFIRRYLDVIDPVHADERTDAFFWRLASGDDGRAAEQAQDAWQESQRDGVNEFAQFWQGGTKSPDEASRTAVAAIAAIEKDRRALLWMARNPYLLNILLGLYLEDRLPPHHERRAAVFASFVDDLLLRERERYRKATGEDEPPGQGGLLESLGKLAWDLQNSSIEGSQQNVQTTVLMPTARQLLSQVQMDHAQAASLIEVRGEQVFFTHQLLQEYFAALGLKAEIDAERLLAKDLWPAKSWWERQGWEEVVNTLGGLYLEHPDRLVRWLGDANPEVLADSLTANGIPADRSRLLIEKSREWIRRMTDSEREPDPAARAAVGRAVGKLDLDYRPGVALDDRGLPDIDWVEIPSGQFLYGEEKETRELPTFCIARYLITNAQFQAFVDDGGYAEKAHWWEGLEVHIEQPDRPYWSERNRPRESVSWYEAMAFCRWLSDRLGYKVRLPTETEWEKAARGTDGRAYPWGDDYQIGHANVNEKSAKEGPADLQQTTAVGLYSRGASPYGVADMAGNVWEWCLNEYLNPDLTQPGGDAGRVLRGGSWASYPDDARASLHGGDFPGTRDYNTGFHVVCSAPITR